MAEESEKKKLTGKEQRAQEKKRCFINAAADLLRTHLFRDVTLRMVANATNYNSASIYTYFKDLNELLLYAVYKLSREYIQELNDQVPDEMGAVEQYESLYAVLAHYTYRHPQMYLHYFFGTHGYVLEDIVQEYEAIFPDDRMEYKSGIVQDLFNKGGLYSFHHVLANHLAEDGYIKKDKRDMLASLLSHMQKSYLYDLANFPDFSPEFAEGEMMARFHQLILLMNSEVNISEEGAAADGEPKEDKDE